MDFGTIIGIAIVIGLAWGLYNLFSSKVSQDHISERRTTRPVPPLKTSSVRYGSTKRTPPARRRRRDGGFYPVGYTGEYYDDEPLVDGLTVLASMALWDAAMFDQYGETGYMDEWSNVDYSSTQPFDPETYEEYIEPEPVVEPEPVYEEPVQAEADTFEDLTETPPVVEDDSTRWGGGFDDSSSGSDWDSGGSEDFGGFDD